MNKETKIWFITDIHGSDICFRKFLNSTYSRKEPNVLIIGGDITGKFLVPIIKLNSGNWKVNFEGDKLEFRTDKEVRDYEKSLSDRGAYFTRCTLEEAKNLQVDENYYNKVVEKLQIERLTKWIEQADKKFKDSNVKVFINPGNDDPFFVNELLEKSESIIMPDEKVVKIDNYVTMASLGFGNPTPWNCPRDISEKELEVKINNLVEKVPDLSKCIFNFHVPPYNTVLDKAKDLDINLRPKMSGLGIEEISVGSTAIRKAIEKYQPLLTLHGHIHEQHAYCHIDKTICFNPGSEYYERRVQGVYLILKEGRLIDFGLTREEKKIYEKTINKKINKNLNPISILFKDIMTYFGITSDKDNYESYTG